MLLVLKVEFGLDYSCICLINEALQCLYSIILQSNLFHCPEVKVFHHRVPLMLKCLDGIKFEHCITEQYLSTLLFLSSS